MLANDVTTIAVEVPVWFWAKEINEGISGHIDILQIRNNKVFILDYKPEAVKDKKAIGQLFLYARALSLRLGLTLDDVRCAWFDEENYFEFNPALANYKGVQV
jgi:ATP-dependent exoDNAse (exonuclease V) beta subunit